MSVLACVNSGPTHGIPYKHKFYWDWVLDLETRLALRLFAADEAERKRITDLFGPTPLAIVTTSPYYPDGATLWVDGKIRETFRGPLAWRNAVIEAKRINDYERNKTEVKPSEEKPVDLGDIDTCNS